MANSERANFTSKLGLILATAGTAVGLGNIWRFPVLTGNNGGAVFLLVYMISIILLGIPLMTAEFAVGRHARSNTAQAYGKLTNHWFLRNIGKIGVYTGWFILCYYIVVSAWTLDYLIDAVMNRFNELAQSGNPDAYSKYFNDFVTNPYIPIIYLVIFMLISHGIIICGVQKGIERFSKILMPLLFIILVVLCVCSFFTEGTKDGLSFLFKPDFGKLTFKTVLDAMGQAFYSLSIGMGCVCTYASYFSNDTKLVNTAFKVSIIDTVVAIMAGIIIFPAVFSTGIRPDAGASLVFIALPNVFQQAFGSIPLLGYIVSVLFYFLLVLATLTSVMSLVEVPVAHLTEDFKLSRNKATTVVTIITIIVGSLCSLSMGPWKEMKLFGKNLFDLFDFTSGQILVPISGFLIAMFVGWFMKRDAIWQELTNGSMKQTLILKILVVLLKYFAPFVILFIFLSGLGIINIL